MPENTLAKHEERGTLALHAVDPGLYSIHPAPLRGKDTLELEEGELVEVPVRANTPHVIKWTPDGDSTEQGEFTGIEVGEGRRKLVNLQLPRTDYCWASLAGIFILALAAIVLSAWAAFGDDPPRSTLVRSTLPVGTLMPFAGALNQARRDSLEQQGWCPAEGQTIPRPPNDSAPYWKIHGAIGSLWGTNLSGNAFKLPDLRGQFVRGVELRNECNDRTSQVDKSEASCRAGSTQNHATSAPNKPFVINGTHSHEYEDIYMSEYERLKPDGVEHLLIPDDEGHDASIEYEAVGWYVKRTTSPEELNNHSIEGGDTETRPRNVAVNWLVYVGVTSCP